MDLVINGEILLFGKEDNWVLFMNKRYVLFF